MVTIEAVRASNARIKSFNPGLVAIFVGGTSGIAESTVKHFCFFAVKPSIYLVGRNEDAANRIISELQDIDSDGTYNFIKKDVSTIYNVDDVCKQIKAKEKKVNLLFMTCGTLSTKGFNPTVEGIDRKMATNYYSRMRFTQQLMPLLEAAEPELSRVVSVLAPGTEKSSFDPEDMGLEDNFSISKAANHAPIMTSFFFEQAAKDHPSVSFIHSFPGFVKTGFAKESSFLIRAASSAATTLLSPWVVPIGESGERHLYISTNGRYQSKTGGTALPATKKEGGPMKGSDEQPGSGAYLVGKDGEFKANAGVLSELRLQDMRDRIYLHTLALFDRVMATETSPPSSPLPASLSREA